jgi:hypothetical protein
MGLTVHDKLIRLPSDKKEVASIYTCMASQKFRLEV